jgi:hypothetical protein
MILNLDNNDINVVMQSLEQGPFRLVAPVVMKIQAQIMAQQAPAKPEVVEPAEIIAAGGTD